MNSLQEYLDAIRSLCLRFKVRKLYAFGSVLSNRFRSESDIDLLVDFETMKVEDYADNYFDFKFSLEGLLKRTVDLLEDKAINNPYLRKKIDQEKELIYG